MLLQICTKIFHLGTECHDMEFILYSVHLTRVQLHNSFLTINLHLYLFPYLTLNLALMVNFDSLS